MSDEITTRERLHLTCVEASERLVDLLSINGFQCLPSEPKTWRGAVFVDELKGRTLVDVEIPSDYPYVQPRVRPMSRRDAEKWLGADVPDYYEPSNSWHLECNGYLCLFEDEDHTRLPWADPKELLDQVRGWFAEDSKGWPRDPPALDLERYLPRHTGELVLYRDLAELRGSVVSLRHRRPGLLELGRPAKMRPGRRGKRDYWRDGVALVLDIGSVDSPIRDWQSLQEAVGGARPTLESGVAAGIREVVLAYERGNSGGVLAMRLIPNGRGGWTIEAHRTASIDDESLMARSHPDRAVLAQRRVVVVGVGAVGSVIADLLHRSGVGELRLIDADKVLPGNVVRHLVGGQYVGEPKVHAVRRALLAARPTPTSSVVAEQRRISSLEQACDVLRSADLVVDASADSTASPLIAAAARAGAGRALGVAVLADGYAIRVDHWPEPSSGALPPSVLPPRALGTFETGCSSPLSTTPPNAVWEAAAMGARHAINTLIAEDECPDEERILSSWPRAS